MPLQTRPNSPAHPSTDCLRKKLVVVGDSAGGKTYLLLTFYQGFVAEENLPVVFEPHVKELLVSGRKLELVLVDTTGQEDYVTFRRQTYEAADVLIVCFAVDNPQSFDNATDLWAPEVKELCPGVPFLLVGYRKPSFLSQREESGPEDSTIDGDTLSRRFVDSAVGEEAAKEIGATGYFECSPCEAESVREMFKAAAELTLRREEEHSASEDSLCCMTCVLL